jgi:hypothetical protein
MSTRLRHLFAVAVLCAAVGLTSVSVAAAAKVITPQGVGPLHLGATAKQLQNKHLIGGLRKGCELVPGQRVAQLRAPLRGFAVFAAGKKRLSGLTVSAGVETARHVRIGTTAKAARAAYPGAVFQAPGTVEPFPVGFLWVPNLNRPRITMVIKPGSLRVGSISVPAPNFCE